MVLPELRLESPTQEETRSEAPEGQAKSQLILVAAQPIQPEQPVGEPFAELLPRRDPTVDADARNDARYATVVQPRFQSQFHPVKSSTFSSIHDP